MFNKIIGVLACILLGIILYRAETRMDHIEQRLNKIDDIIQTTETVKWTPQDRDCLTKNIYYEAGVENVEGKYAVAHVTLNRVKTGQWGNNVCKVVYAKKQFSWTLQKKLPKPNAKLWAESQTVATNVLNGARVRGLDKSLFYHAVYIKDPKWVDPKQEAGQIGNHVFYNRAKGSGVMI